jgi:hypothetical protein
LGYWIDFVSIQRNQVIVLQIQQICIAAIFTTDMDLTFRPSLSILADGSPRDHAMSPVAAGNFPSFRGSRAANRHFAC